MEMVPLFPSCDWEHWLVIMVKPGGEGAAKQQMINCYIQTLAKVFSRSGLPGVLFVLLDSYVDPENKDYGDAAELFVNGDMVQIPERQRRVEPLATSFEAWLHYVR